MARLMQMTTAIFNETGMSEIYTIDSGVGRGRANRRDDVMLVQLLLKKADAISISAGLPGLHESNLKVDGICGPTTLKFIEGFGFTGTLTRGLGQMNVANDDGFDPLPANRSVKSSNGLWYKIFAVNVRAKQNMESRTPNYNSLIDDPQTPPLLRAALMGNRRID